MKDPGRREQERDERESEMVTQVAHNLAEHFDAVQILVSRHEGETTRAMARGSGNWHSRLGMMREFLVRTEGRIAEEGRRDADQGED